MKQLWTLAALCAVVGAAQAAPKQCVDVRLSSDALVLRGDVDVPLKVQVTNTCRHPVQVLSWQLPGDEIENRLFRIVRDGMFPVAYTGPLAKRAKPGPEDPDAPQHLQRRLHQCGRPLVVVARRRSYQDDLQAQPRQVECRHEPRRPGAGDDDFSRAGG